MAAAAVGTIAVTIFLVAGAAVWLIMVAVNLQQITHQLETVQEAATGIAGQVKPVPGVVSAIARDVGAIQGALHGLISLATSAAPAPGPRPARAAATTAAPVADAPAPRSGPNRPAPVNRRY